MKLYHFGKTAKQITQYDSLNALVTHLARGETKFSVVVIVLEGGGVVGRHPATENQLFFVISGAGTVSGEDDRPMTIEAGQMAFWQAGESHETRSEQGLTAVVIEGQGLEPNPSLIVV
jgi:quercetin dioxygenase-like cupin family protein